MSRRVMLVTAAVAALVIIGAAVTWWTGREDPGIRRAKELLGIDEYSSAAKELKIALKKSSAPDAASKAMLLYAVTRADTSDPKGLESLLTVQPAVALMVSGGWPDYVDTEEKNEVNKNIIKLRRSLFEQGVDTRDARELSEVLMSLARYVMIERDKDAARDIAAFVLATSGKPEAVQHLVERLKGENTELVENLLLQLRSEAASALRKVADDPQNLGRESAVRILSKVQAVGAARAVFSSYPRARAVFLDDLPEPLRTPINKGFLEKLYVPGVTRLLVEQGVHLGASKWVNRHELHTDYVSLRSDERGLLVLSGFDDQRKHAFSRFFRFDRVDYRPLSVKLKGQVLKGLEGDAPIVRARVLGEAMVELSRPEVVPIEVEEISGSGSAAPGARVAVRGHRGTVESTDDVGLVTIKLDTAVQGETKLVVPPTLLRGMVKRTLSRPGYRNLVASLSGDVLEVREDLSSTREQLDAESH